jgi:hypothetical protein
VGNGGVTVRGARPGLLAAAVTGAALAAAAPAAAAAVQRTGARAYAVTVNGAPQSDLTVARLDFRLGAYARHPTRRALRFAVRGPTGLNYLAAGRLLPPTRTTLTALVALVNRRPPGSLAPDLAFVRIDVAGARLTHRPRVTQVVGAFARRRRASAVAPPMCVQTPRTLEARDVAAVFASGPGFGFPPQDVIAQGFDAACSRPVDPAFERAVTHTPACRPTPCDPRMGVACPLTGQAIVCPQPATRR